MTMMPTQNPQPPFEGELAVIAVSTSSGAADLADAAHLGPLVAAENTLFCLTSDQILYFRMATATGTADETATSGANRVGMLAAGEPYFFRFREGARLNGEAAGLATWIVHKAAGAGYLRVWKCSSV